MFVTNWISTTKIQKISEITNFFRHYFLSRTEVTNKPITLSYLHFDFTVLMIEVIMLRYAGSVAYLHPTPSHILRANW